MTGNQETQQKCIKASYGCQLKKKKPTQDRNCELSSLSVLLRTTAWDTDSQ